jgi:hypothetical protein
MKKILMVLFIAFLFLGACKKEKSNDFVNDFIPILKEKANTKYIGNYFPLNLYNGWSWDGEMKTSGNFYVGNTSLSLDGSGDAYESMIVGDTMTVHLSTGSYYVHITNESDGTSRYFQVTDTAVFLRAMYLNDSSDLVEVKNPLFIKNTLVVGDKWQTQPNIDVNSLISKLSQFGVSGIKINVKSKIFVLGKEFIDIYGLRVPTIALQERVEMTGSITFNGLYTGTLNMNAIADIQLNLEKDTGIVRQVSVINENADGNLKYAGTSGNIKINLTINQTAILSDFRIYNYYKKSVESKEISLTDQLKGNKLFNKQLDAVSKLFVVIQKLSMP